MSTEQKGDSGSSAECVRIHTFTRPTRFAVVKPIRQGARAA
jgi:hypothetical protein